MKLTVGELKEAISDLKDSDEITVEIGGDESSYGEVFIVERVDLKSDFKLLLSCENQIVGY